jgi:hypothetical protein
MLFFHQLNAQIPGCTDQLATNFNASATQNDGSCFYKEAFIMPYSSENLPEYLNETSGLIFWNQKIWTHNDDTDTKLYSINSRNISDIKSFNLTGTVNKDWEDISHDNKYIYVGDFGNNIGNRTDLKILRIEKNSMIFNNPKIDTIAFRYSLQTNFNSPGSNNHDFDCEAFVVTSDSIYLFTKEWVSKMTSIYVLPKNPGNHVANFKAKYDVQGLVTGATLNESKKIIVLSAYTALLQPFLMLLYDYNGNNFLSGNKRKVLVNAPFHQVEGICSENDLKYIISNEKYSQSGISITQKIHRLDLTEYLGNYVNSIVSITPKLTIKNVTIFPNPASTNVTIMSPAELIGLDYTISDIFGRTILNGQIKSENTVLELKNIDKGFYIVCINNSIFKRLIIK